MMKKLLKTMPYMLKELSTARFADDTAFTPLTHEKDNSLQPNFISTIVGGGRIKCYEKYFFTKTIALKFLILFILVFGGYIKMVGQNCGFDNSFDYSNIENLVLNTPPTAGLPNGNSSVQIPVVFHVIHEDGEVEGQGSNVTTTNIINCLAKLNQDFNSSLFDVNFCFAARDPNNNATNGITRISGSNIPGYTSFGLFPYGNEYAIKELGDYWANTDYINIWVVKHIEASVNYAGLATFPFTTAPEYDGIIIEADEVNGTSTVLTHEMGHFLGLYHTFEGGTNVNCPTNTPCDTDPNNNNTEICCRVQGDKCCDTPPHKEEYGCPTGTNTCDNTNYSLITNNYMSYYLSCQSQFTLDQYTRMSIFLSKFRVPLLTSPCCSAPCSNVNADFLVDENYIYNEPIQVEFDNQSIGNINTSSWLHISPTIQIVEYSGPGPSDGYLDVFEVGRYENCLTVSDDNCTDRLCKSILIVPEVANCSNSSFCNIVKNSDLSINNLGSNVFHFKEFFQFDKVCNWYNADQSPFYCEFNANQKSLGMNCAPIFKESEKIGIIESLELNNGDKYKVDLEYFVLSNTNAKLNSVKFLLAETPDKFNTINEYFIIHQLNQVSPDQIENSIIGRPSPCYLGQKNFNNYTFTFEYNSELMGKYFAIGGLSDGAEQFLYIRNLKISKCLNTCGGELAIVKNKINDCTYEFGAVISEPVEDYKWTFDCEPTITGSSLITQTFYYPGPQQVCLTVNCDNKTTKICETITIPESCNNLMCDFIVPIEIPVFKCKESNTALANISFNIPKGYKPCKKEMCIDGNIAFEEQSYLINTSNPSFDVFNLALTMNNAELNQIFTFILCGPNGEILCNKFKLINIQECDVCTPISATANCTDTNPNDGIHSYSGTITIPGLSSNATLCGDNSSQAGFIITGVSATGENTNVNFNMNSTQQGGYTTTSLLCFNDPPFGQQCFIITITIPAPCAPENCEEVTLGTVNCESTNVEGNAVFDISMALYREIIGRGYILCGQDGVSFDNGTFVLNGTTYNVTPDRFSIEGDLTIPCEDLAELTEINMTLHFCNSGGKLECVILTIPIECNGCGKGGVKDHRSRIISSNKFLDFYPNPTNGKLTININDTSHNNYEVRLLNNLEQLLMIEHLKSGANFINLESYQSGAYFISYKDSEGINRVEKLVIIK